MKLLLDENLSQPQWLPKFQDQTNPWLTITADGGKRCGGDRLPRICKDLGIRHVLLSGKLHQRRQFDKIRALFAVWPDLKLANASSAGSRYKLQQAGDTFVLKAA